MLKLLLFIPILNSTSFTPKVSDEVNLAAVRSAAGVQQDARLSP